MNLERERDTRNATACEIQTAETIDPRQIGIELAGAAAVGRQILRSIVAAREFFEITSAQVFQCAICQV